VYLPRIHNAHTNDLLIVLGPRVYVWWLVGAKVKERRGKAKFRLWEKVEEEKKK